MPRATRTDFAGAWHHVYTRGNRRQEIFRERRDYALYMATLFDVVRDFGWRVHGYVLLPNHTHLVLETPSATLSKGMKQLNGTYATRFNMTHDLVGHVFQGRFGSRLISGNEDLARTLWYLAMNPVEAGLCEQPEEYEWSSYAALCGRAPMQPFLFTIIARELTVMSRPPVRPRLDDVLSPATDDAVRRAYDAGYTVRAIAGHLGVGVATVSRRLERNKGV
jgi:putative transposase